jgi:CMP-N,N'-diacetyllegionaminic acid synthase
MGSMKFDGNKMNLNILAVTLARGGSKQIKNKNIVDLCGKPLIAYTIESAFKSKFINDYIVSTDDSSIAEVVAKMGVEVPFMRPAELSTDNSTSADSLLHALKFMESRKNLKYDIVVELMTTNPFKTAEDIDNCIKMLTVNNADSVIAVHRVIEHHPARIKKVVNGRIVDFCIEEKKESRRQDLLPYAYIRSGAIYALNRNWFVKTGTRYGSQNSFAYILSEEKSVNIDNETDLEIARSKIRKNLN